MAHYDDVIVPNQVRFGSSSGPATSTQVLFTGGGHRKANQRWSQHLRRFQLSYVRKIEDLFALQEIFEAVEGPAHSFLARDWNDWNTRADANMAPGAETGVTAFDQPLRNTSDNSFTGDGTTKTFQMVKRYVVGSAAHTRVIQKPQSGTIKVGVDSAEQSDPGDYSFDPATGIVTFVVAPGASVSPTAVAVTWGGAFYVPVAFVQDQLPQTLRTAKTSGLPSIPLIGVRL